MIVQRIHIEAGMHQVDFAGDLKTMLAAKQALKKQGGFLVFNYGHEEQRIDTREITSIEYQYFDEKPIYDRQDD